MTEEEKKEHLLHLAKRIKELRRERGLTQADCLNDTGIHFARIEQGKRDISYITILKLLEYFNVNSNDLLGK